MRAAAPHVPARVSTRMHIMPLAVLLLLTACALAPCDALIEGFHFESTQRAKLVVQQFGMDKGATFSVDATAVVTDETNVYFMMLTQDQKRFAEDQQDLSLCIIPAAYRAPVKAGINIFDATIEHAALYYMVFINCPVDEAGDSVAYEVDGTLWMLNPGGEHLPLQWVPLGDVASVYLVLYVCIAVAWGVNLHQWRAGHTVLHRWLTIAVFAKMCEMGAVMRFYYSYSDTGHRHSGVWVLREVLRVVADTTFLVVLLLTAFGWTVTRTSLTGREKQTFTTAFLLFAMFGLLQGTCIDQTGVCSLFLMSYYVIRFLLTFAIIVAMNANIERLRASRFQSTWFPSDGDVIAKLRMFQRFRWVFLFYLVHPILLLFIQVSVLTWEEEWVYDMLQYAVVMFVYVVVGYSFRPRENNAQYTAVADAPEEGELNEADAAFMAELMAHNQRTAEQQRQHQREELQQRQREQLQRQARQRERAASSASSSSSASDHVPHTDLPPPPSPGGGIELTPQPRRRA